MKLKSKLCSRCGKKFIPTNNAQKYCKKCREIVQKQQTKGWREAHPGYFRQWYKAHSEQVKQQSKRWGETHPEQVKQYMKKWREAHPGYFKHKSH